MARKPISLQSRALRKIPVPFITRKGVRMTNLEAVRRLRSRQFIAMENKFKNTYRGQLRLSELAKAKSETGKILAWETYLKQFLEFSQKNKATKRIIRKIEDRIATIERNST